MVREDGITTVDSEVGSGIRERQDAKREIEKRRRGKKKRRKKDGEKEEEAEE